MGREERESDREKVPKTTAETATAHSNAAGTLSLDAPLSLVLS